MKPIAVDNDGHKLFRHISFKIGIDRLRVEITNFVNFYLVNSNILLIKLQIEPEFILWEILSHVYQNLASIDAF